MTGAGIDALTVRNIDLRAKRRFKELAFVGTGLKSGPRRRRLRSSWCAPAGASTPATFFVAGNSRYYAAHIGGDARRPTPPTACSIC